MDTVINEDEAVVPPKAPGPEIKPYSAIVDDDGVRHWVWCDEVAISALSDMGFKLMRAEAEIARLKGQMQ